MVLTLMAKLALHSPQLDDADTVPNELKILFGRNVRAARIALGFRQQDFADRAGFTQQYISLVENGQVNPTLGNMERFATALNQDVPSLLRPANPGFDDPDS